jgi:hypothetical protein
MGGRAVYGSGLENRQGFAPLVGSNPTPSAKFFPGSCQVSLAGIALAWAQRVIRRAVRIRDAMRSWSVVGRIAVRLALLIVVIALVTAGMMYFMQGKQEEWAQEKANDPQSVLPYCLQFPNMPPLEKGLCVGYLKAIAHVMSRDPIARERACIPKSATLGDLQAGVATFVRANPQQVQQVNTDVIVARALAAAFPCR